MADDKGNPVSELLRTVVNMEGALRACVDAHKTGRHEPMQSAIEQAQKVLAEWDSRKLGRI